METIEALNAKAERVSRPMPELTGRRAIELLREVVAGKEDFVYEAPDPELKLCVYTYGGACSCLVGHALLKAGYDIEQIRALDVVRDGLPTGAGDIPNHLPDVTHAAADIFDAAQAVQDNGQTWRNALDSAESVAAALGVN